jgi:putative membrane protein
MLLVGSGGCAGPFGAHGAPAGGGAEAMVSKQDQRFVAEAVPAGLAEVELGRLAAQHASDGEVRAFGQRMVEDHGQTNEHLLAFARHYRVDAPRQLDRAHQQAKDALSHLRGEAFDRAYIQGRLHDYEQSLALYQRQAEQGKAAALQALAQTTAPTLQEHLQAAREIASEIQQAR